MEYKSVFRSDLFTGKNIIVTGGGSGIGRCAAHELASLGAEISLVGRTEQKLLNVKEEIYDMSKGTVQAFACDIRDEQGVRKTVTDILQRFGRVDALVNNAGGQYIASLENITFRGWDAVISTNLTGGFLMARECYTQWMREHGGAIVNVIADMWRSMPGMAHSGAARAGMLNLTQTAAVEWAPRGVRVNAIAPGWIASSGLGTYPDEVRPMLRRLPRTVPLGRFGMEAEVSAGIAFLLSPAAAFITGSCLRVDGGAPNAQQYWQESYSRSTEPFDGFPLAKSPKFLDD